MNPPSSFSIDELSLFHSKLRLIFFILKVSYIFTVEEYINQCKDGFLVDPDQDLIYTKRKLARKLAKQNESPGTNTATGTTKSSIITFSTANNFSFAQHGWGINLKMPLLTKADGSFLYISVQSYMTRVFGYLTLKS